MGDILKAILASPATAYILSFGGLGILLVLAVNNLNKFFSLSSRATGLLLVLSGALGGLMMQSIGLVDLPGNNNTESYIFSCFVGAATAAAAAGFSDVDLRAAFKKDQGNGTS